MSWGIAETAPEIEKIKAESADYLNGLNSCGEIDYSAYSYAFDFYHDLLDKAYAQGKADAQPQRMKGRWQSGDSAGAYCSECEHYTPFPYRPYTFCPDCGANMREEKHEQKT